MRQICIIALVFIFPFSGCNKKQYTPEDYMQWAYSKGNPLLKSKQIGELAFFSRLITQQEQVIRNTDSKNLNQSMYNKELNDVEGMLVFNLVIDMSSHKGSVLKYKVNSVEQFNENQYYFFYQFKDNIFLDVEGKKYPCRLYNFERSYGLGSKITMEVAFEKPGNYKKGMSLIINPEVYDLGNISFYYSNNDLQNLPQLKLNS